MWEGGGMVSGGGRGEGQDEREQKNTDGVVPVKQLETVRLDAFVGVGPGAPANGAGDHHQQSESETVRDEHRAGSPYIREALARRLLERRCFFRALRLDEGHDFATFAHRASSHLGAATGGTSIREQADAPMVPALKEAVGRPP